MKKKQNSFYMIKSSNHIVYAHLKFLFSTQMISQGHVHMNHRDNIHSVSFVEKLNYEIALFDIIFYC